ncbi:hypothetical protein [Jeotgalibacillus sp. S-D1]|nr:hypothetical protein [Jeotgalibacillus sp. S-D1]
MQGHPSNNSKPKKQIQFKHMVQMAAAIAVVLANAVKFIQILLALIK